MAVHEKDHNQLVVERAKNFWERYNRPVMIGGVVIILIAAAYIGYSKFYKSPNEQKASEALYRAETYFRSAMMIQNPDSVLKLSLNGDGANPGLLRVISKYKGTKAANLAKFYAGQSYLMLNDNNNAVKYLKDFSTGSKLFQGRAYKLLGDAYADLGKDADAYDNYKKGGRHFEEDIDNAAESLFLAAYLAEKKLNKPKEAIELYKEIKEKFSPATTRWYDADKNLARLGVLSTD